MSLCAFFLLRSLVENTRLARHPEVHGVGFMDDAGMLGELSYSFQVLLDVHHITLSLRTSIFPLLNLTNQFSWIQDTYVTHMCDILYS